MKTETIMTMPLTQFTALITRALKPQLKYVDFNKVEINIINKETAVIHFISAPILDGANTDA